VKKRFAILGVLTILFWLSLSPYVYALWPWREYSDVYFWFNVALICTGIISGVLLLVHPRSGRIVAVTLCAGMILHRIWSLMRSYPHIGDRLHGIFFLLLPSRPVYVIHCEIVALAFYITTIALLWRKRIA
jgi:hypothetical protein